jgi:hypothetical protein
MLASLIISPGTVNFFNNALVVKYLQLQKFKLLKCLSFEGNHSNFNSMNFEADQNIYEVSKEMMLVDKCLENF